MIRNSNSITSSDPSIERLTNGPVSCSRPKGSLLSNNEDSFQFLPWFSWFLQTIYVKWPALLSKRTLTISPVILRPSLAIFRQYPHILLQILLYLLILTSPLDSVIALDSFTWSGSLWVSARLLFIMGSFPLICKFPSSRSLIPLISLPLLAVVFWLLILWLLHRSGSFLLDSPFLGCQASPARLSAILLCLILLPIAQL